MRPVGLLGLVPGDSPSAGWTWGLRGSPPASGVDLKGPHIQGPLGGRFINWNDRREMG